MTFVYIFLGGLAALFVIGMIVVKPENAGSRNGIVITPPANATFDIPDIGSPGTASDAQKNAVKTALGMMPVKDISSDQASYILDARQYARGIIAEFARGGVEIDDASGTRAIMYFIMTRPDTWEYVGRWGRGRFERGTNLDVPRLTKNEHYQKVYDYLVSQTGREPVKPAKRTKAKTA
ncbi:hypothetical protein [Thalassospira marina]|uniref:Uncharacterized protein n=1 Tax=Thalassospira marina TaxID=2048283 RepID=A0A2N3KJN7_9PROT|nr:hypothetical protein [Thalassospira marina]PKR50765.1 hypothetical protein COO20_20220 [Thalassospira marina]